MLSTRRSSKNCLLQKDDVGHPKPSTHNLPGASHTFGSETRPDAINVGGCKLTNKFYQNKLILTGLIDI